MPKKRRVHCKDCVFLKVRLDREGRADYWCIVRQVNLGQSVLWRKGCGDFAGDDAVADRKRDLP